MQANLILGLTLIATALIVATVCVPLLKGRIKMNPVYGMRLPKSFESEEAWYAINRYGARRFIIWSIALMAIGVMCFFVPFGKNTLTVFAFSPLVYLIAALETYLYARKI